MLDGVQLRCDWSGRFAPRVRGDLRPVGGGGFVLFVRRDKEETPFRTNMTHRPASGRTHCALARGQKPGPNGALCGGNGARRGGEGGRGADGGENGAGGGP